MSIGSGKLIIKTSKKSAKVEVAELAEGEEPSDNLEDHPLVTSDDLSFHNVGFRVNWVSQQFIFTILLANTAEDLGINDIQQVLSKNFFNAEEKDMSEWFTVVIANDD